jgi:hypothetical protein
MLERARPAPARTRSLYPRYAAAAAAILLLIAAAIYLPDLIRDEPAVVLADERVEEEAAALSAPAPRRPEPVETEQAPVVEKSQPPPPPPPVVAASDPPVEAVEEADMEVAAANTAPTRPESEPIARIATAAAMPVPEGDVIEEVARARAAPLISGTVTNEDGQPIAGADIRRPGQALGVTSDTAGRFQLPYDATLDEVSVSAEGYQEEEIAVFGEEEELQISLSEVPERTPFDAFMEAAARTQVQIEPEIPEPAVARPEEGYRALRRRIEANRPDSVPPGRVRVSFLVAEDGTLSDFRFRGQPDRATMDYVGNTLVESSAWEVVRSTRPVRVHLKLRFE